MTGATIINISRKGKTYEEAKHEALVKTAKVVDGVQVVLTIVRCRISRSSYRFEVA